jgi:hypothetical protein
MGQFNLLSHIRKLEIMKLKEYTNIQDYIEIKKSEKKLKKDNSKKGDVFLNCRCCGVLIAPDWYSQLDKRYCQDCF